MITGPVAVNKLGVLDIPNPLVPDHFKVWMSKIDDLTTRSLTANHYLCIQYAHALQFTVSSSQNAGCIEAFIAAMSQFYKITEDMWRPHFPTALFAKPHME